MQARCGNEATNRSGGDILRLEHLTPLLSARWHGTPVVNSRFEQRIARSGLLCDVSNPDEVHDGSREQKSQKEPSRSGLPE
jgi:hypothetical protein